MKRLLVISHGYPPYFGGAEHAAGALAEAAAASGRWQVEVLTSDLGGRQPAHEIANGVQIHRVPARKRAWRQHTVGELVSFLRAARRWRPDAPVRWDLILAHFTLPAGAVAQTLARAADSPYAVVLHGSDVPGYQNRRFGLLYPLVTSWCRSIWSAAHTVVAVSPDLRDLALRTWPRGRIAVVANGVDTSFFRPDPAIEPQRGLLVAVAQLIPRKGLSDLVQALTDPRLAECRLHLCGVGPAEAALRRQAASSGLRHRVEFLGLVERSRLPALLRSAQAFVLPSHREGHPLALLEAMACARPVIATAVGGIPDLIRSGENGWLVPPGQPAALADALALVLADRSAAARCGQAARRTAEALAWPRIWERYEAIPV